MAPSIIIGNCGVCSTIDNRRPYGRLLSMVLQALVLQVEARSFACNENSCIVQISEWRGVAWRSADLVQELKGALQLE